MPLHLHVQMTLHVSAEECIQNSLLLNPWTW